MSPRSPDGESTQHFILGGTGFTGPEQWSTRLRAGTRLRCSIAIARGPILQGRVEQLIGDLNADVSALKERSSTWSSTTDDARRG